ncbi:MAG: virulence RhuM family protein [Bacteroidales bacterium]|nr:virulence RhuM family protein [Bacteroidales bacterium]MDD3893056.1 virulence RhuM family protein [Bacteroidales bacterium]
MKEEQKGEILIYQSEEGKTKIEVRLENETAWLTQKMMAELFQTTPQNITIHLKNIYEEGELKEDATCKDSLQVQTEGSRRVERKQLFYNLDAIISVGYRIKSHIATKFRIWATERLKEYIVKGFTMDDDRLKQMGGGVYWYELLNRIRDIRSSEKVLYRQVLDLYATSVDYNPNTPESVKFFKIIQNKLHYAAHGSTAAEVIYQRANSNSPFMGLTVFEGEQPTSKDITVAKNYLNADELKILNNLVSGYFDFAEIQAMKRKPMYMTDYIKQLDNILSATGENLLQNAGTVSHQQALEKAKAEFKKFQVKTLSAVEKHYLESIKGLQKKIDKKGTSNE